MEPIDAEEAEHVTWGNGCDGWHLVEGEDLSVVTELVPPDAGEERHRHRNSRQFFYVLRGRAVVEIDGNEHRLTERQGIEVPPGEPHQFLNRSDDDVEFLVISAPTSRGDRIGAPRE